MNGRPALLLVDLQRDFLGASGLEPPPGRLIERVSTLLTAWRRDRSPVIHVWTTVKRDPDTRMPHWRRAGRWDCLEGTPGHATPEELRPQAGEEVLDKTAFSPFLDGQLEALLRRLGTGHVVVAGVHAHGCVRAAVLDAYQRGFEVLVAEDAVGSDEPVHAALTRSYLEPRAATYLSAGALLARARAHPGRAVELLPAAVVGDTRIAGDAAQTHRSPRDLGEVLWTAPECDGALVARAVEAARSTFREWRRTGAGARAAAIGCLATLLRREREDLALRLALETGKPIRDARAEEERAAVLAELAALNAEDGDDRRGDEATARRRPLGAVAIVTPFNSPVAIPIGKIAPALAFGNTAVWKPAPPALSVSLRLLELLTEAGVSSGAVNLVSGHRSTGEALLANAGIGAITVTGSPSVGYSAQLCAARGSLPLQAELGGNNGAIVWSDCDLESAARELALGAFGQAGQRCTANRRVVIEAHCMAEFLEALERAAAELVVGDPLGEATDVGPLISQAARERVTAAVERAVRGPARIVAQLRGGPPNGAHYPPTVIRCDDPGDEIVQHETFGPVMVIQRAEDFEEALSLLNGVRQGLAASLFSPDEGRRERFLDEAQAGILKLDRATSDAGAAAPFGGWKASGVGPPEHGEGDREFYTRAQAVYGAASDSDGTSSSSGAVRA